MAKVELTTEEARRLFEQEQAAAAKTLANHRETCRKSIDEFERRVDRELGYESFGPLVR